MRETTIIIKTFERKRSLWRLLESISEHYATVPIIIVDDSRANYKKETLLRFPHLDLKYIVSDFDIGLSKGRNILLGEINTEYFLLCDDDFEFDSRTNLKRGLDLLIAQDLDLLGGVVYNVFKIDTLYSFLWALKKPKRFIDVYNGKEEISVYNGMFTVDSGRHVELTICKNYAAYLDDIIYRTDLVSNFFIAKTESIRAVVGWQPEHVKVGEHQAFFLRLKLQGAKVAFTRCFGVKHYPRKTLRYNRYRLRTSRMFKESLQYLNVDSYVIKNDMGEVVFVYKKEAT